MSLVVWLPLNGNLENQGLSNMTFSYKQNNGALSINNSGKIGKCYERTASEKNDLIRSSTTINLSGNISMACWAYVSSTIGDTANGLITNHSHVDNTGVGITVKQLSSSDYRISCNTGTGSNRTFYTYYGTTNIKNAWHHLALTYDKTAKQLQLWVDGKVEYTLNNYVNASKADYIDIFNWSTTNYTNGNYRPTCKLNDVRVYDHCLSAKEVKDLAKGLVLHYRLAGPGGENLFTNTSPLETKSNNEWIQLGNDTTAIFDTNGLIKYTVSFDAKSEIAGSFNLYSTSGSNPKYTWPNTSINLTTDWQHFSYTFTPTMSNSTGTWSRISIYGTYGTGKIPSIKNVKLERGSVQTPWCPNPADPLYSTLGYNNNIEYDCSGYNRNGTKNGTITLDADSPRYTTSYKMGGTGTSIVGPSDFSHLNTFTYSCWFNRKTTENAYLIMGYQYGNNSSGSLAVSKNGFAGFHCYRFSTGSAETHIAGNINYNDGKWHMLTVTYENNIIKVYVDGIKTAEKNNISLLTSNRTFVINYPSGSINNSEYRDYKGLLSDARVYATALSAEDIAELYHSAVIVDNTGKNYAYEYFET